MAMISCIFQRKTLMETLGFWDSVRFAADSEMISRARNVLGESFCLFPEVGMICLDMDGGLTNDPVHGIRADGGRLAESRRIYKESWSDWHRKYLPDSSAFLPFPLEQRRYESAPDMVVKHSDQLLNISALSRLSARG